MNLNDFNNQLQEELLSPFSEAYLQTLSVFWNSTNDASLYKVELYILDSNQFMVTKFEGIRSVYEKGKQINKKVLETEIVNNSTILDNYGMHLDKQIKVSNKYSAGTVRKIGYKSLYKIDEIYIDKNKNYLSISNLVPNKYIVVISAEDKAGKLISKSRGIEIDLLKTDCHTVSSSYGTSGWAYNTYDVTKAWPKDWNKDDYFKEN